MRLGKKSMEEQWRDVPTDKIHLYPMACMDHLARLFRQLITYAPEEVIEHLYMSDPGFDRERAKRSLSTLGFLDAKEKL
jgi:hypothetical protein